MKKTSENYYIEYIKKILLPCVIFSSVTGVFSAFFITAFKCAVGAAVEASTIIYAYVTQKPILLACLIPAALMLGLITSYILKHSQSCRGGGIPTSIAAIRGITHLNWLKSTFLLPISACISFFVGVPLGTEGPCVQMGTGIGDGVVRALGEKKYQGWRRYMMSAGASSGFALATGAPVTAIIFSMEEIHKRFSPLLISVASISVVTGQLTSHLLNGRGVGTVKLFEISTFEALPLTEVYLPAIIGIVCGLCSMFFAKLYIYVDKIVRVKLKKLTVWVKIPLIFASIALVGFFFTEILGTGHSLIERMLNFNPFDIKNTWYVLIIVFLLRAVFMMVSNTAGVTGGVFLPTLAFGAVVGSLCSSLFVTLGAVGSEHYALLTVIGMVSFLGATSRIPVTACIFAIEILGGINNILAIIIATSVSFLIVELSGLDDFSDIVIESKKEAIYNGKKPYAVTVSLTVQEGAFVIDEELSDVLWPALCVLLSVEKGPNRSDKLGIAAGDVLTVYYKTYNPKETAKEFQMLVGQQSEEVTKIMLHDGV